MTVQLSKLTDVTLEIVESVKGYESNNGQEKLMNAPNTERALLDDKTTARRDSNKPDDN